MDLSVVEKGVRVLTQHPDRFRPHLLLYEVIGLVQADRSSSGIMGVRTDHVDKAVLQEMDGLAAGPLVGYGIRVDVEDAALVHEMAEVLLIAEKEIIALDMGKEGADPPAEEPVHRENGRDSSRRKTEGNAAAGTRNGRMRRTASPGRNTPPRRGR